MCLLVCVRPLGIVATLCRRLRIMHSALAPACRTAEYEAHAVIHA